VTPGKNTAPQSLFQTSLLLPSPPPLFLTSRSLHIKKEPPIQTKAKLSHQKLPLVRDQRHCIPHASSRVASAVRAGRLIRVSRSRIPRTSNTLTYVKIQLTKFLVAAAAFTLANAQVEFTMNADFFAASYVAGVSVMNLTWDLNSGPVTLKLMNGPSTNLSLVETIKSKDL
jgi:hypothetical protein